MSRYTGKWVGPGPFDFAWGKVLIKGVTAQNAYKGGEVVFSCPDAEFEIQESDVFTGEAPDGLRPITLILT